ncbi:hypothetical protein [Nocardioides pantholopis]|uniref:hypothetical protein n=1 Tax=Nocardioides pantholopis TaxID=2483798 RepID=UPI000F098D44|nr:hypothetical protein [Nocardioides pantholopis]
MLAARPVPQAGSIFVDPRGDGRALRVSWHAESGLVVLSLWRDDVCAGSFRLPAGEVPSLVDQLRAGLDAAYAGAAGELDTRPLRVADGHAEAG